MPRTNFDTTVAAQIYSQTNLRPVQWATRRGQSAWHYYWAYPPRLPPTGAASPAAHCSELPFLWRVGCTAADVANKPWEKSQCAFGLQFASFWQSFAAFGSPAGGPVPWPAYGAATAAAGNGGATLVVGDNMTFYTQHGVRSSRCDFWDSHFPRLWG